MDTMDRRTLLRGAAAAAGGVVLGGPLQTLAARAAGASGARGRRGALRAVADLRDGQERLWLPEGFAYRSFHDTEYAPVLHDGVRVPGRHDGMAAFPGPGNDVVLVRNHEVNGPGSPFGDAARAYDARARGGTTTVVVSRTGEVRNSFVSLNGTMMNCSGGAMPWGSWLTCEETVNGPDVGPDFTGAPNTSLREPHGFVFEVPAGGRGSTEPVRAAGRFAHEAAAFDPGEGAVYLTEDNFGFPSGLYRYLPPRNPLETGRLEDGGRLQMLAVAGVPHADLAAAQPRRATYRVRWVDIDDPAPTFTAGTSNDDALRYVGDQGRAQGAASFSRLEGAAWDNGVVYFTSTQGGGAPEESAGPVAGGYGNGAGQVWAYHTRPGVLQLLFQSPGADVLDGPDNVATSRRGTVLVCEDSTDDNYVRGLNRGGQLFDIALNRIVGRNGRLRHDDEFAGATFSPDGTTLFVNVQASQGMTFAIWGPWQRLGV